MTSSRLARRFSNVSGIGAIATARELCPDTPILADTKTVDAGDLEAEMVLGAGARLMTVLSSTSPATHSAVGKVAARFGAFVVVDTITESGKPELLPVGATFPESFAYVGVHSPTGHAGRRRSSHSAHIDALFRIYAVEASGCACRRTGPRTLDAVLEVEPEIVIAAPPSPARTTPEGLLLGSRTDCAIPGGAGCRTRHSGNAGARGRSRAFQRFVDLSSEMRGSPRWFFSGQGRSGLVAEMAAMRFMHIGPPRAFCPAKPQPRLFGAGDGLCVISGIREDLS